MIQSLMIMCPYYRVIASKNSGYAVGDVVVSGGGWCTHFIADSSTQRLGKVDKSVWKGIHCTWSVGHAWVRLSIDVLTLCDIGYCIATEPLHILVFLSYVNPKKGKRL